MSALVKPSWPVWQPAHSLGNGLRAFFAATEPADEATTRDAVSGLTLAAKGGAKTGQGGLLCDAIGKGFEATAPALLRLPLPITIACRVRFLGAAGSDSGGFGLLANDIDSIPWFAATIYFRESCLACGWNSGGAFDQITSSIATAALVGTDSTIVAVFAATSRTLYLDGEAIATASGAYLDPTYGPTALIAAGNYTGINRNSNCLVEGGAIWNRALSAGEVLALTGDFFAPVRHRSNLALLAAMTGGSPVPFVGSPAAMMMGGI